MTWDDLAFLVLTAVVAWWALRDDGALDGWKARDAEDAARQAGDDQ